MRTEIVLGRQETVSCVIHPATGRRMDWRVETGESKNPGKQWWRPQWWPEEVLYSVNVCWCLFSACHPFPSWSPVAMLFWKPLFILPLLCNASVGAQAQNFTAARLVLFWMLTVAWILHINSLALFWGKNFLNFLTFLWLKENEQRKKLKSKLIWKGYAGKYQDSLSWSLLKHDLWVGNAT